MFDLYPGKLKGRLTGLTGVSGGLSGFLLLLLTGIWINRCSYKPVFVIIAPMAIPETAALFHSGCG